MSVIVPTFQRPEFLQAALRSVLSQTVRDFEVLVVDDGSSMPVEPIVRRLDDRRIRYIRHASNQGEAAARNTGIQDARGDYVAFLDDDDEWFPDKLRLQLAVFAGCSARVGCVNGGYMAVRARDGKVLWEEIPTLRGDLSAALARANVVGAPSTVMIRRACFDQIGLFDGRLAFGVDYDLWIRLAQRYEFDFVPQVVARYTVHRGQMSSDPALCAQGHEDLQQKYGPKLRRSRRREARFYLMIGRDLSLGRRTREARRALLKAVAYNPFLLRAHAHLILTFAGGGGSARFRGLLARMRRPEVGEDET